MDAPLRILTVIDSFHPRIGGAEHAALETARSLVARGHHVDILTIRYEPGWPPEESVDGVRIVRFPERVPPRPLGWLLYERANAAAARRFVDASLADPPYDLILLHPIDAAFGVSRSRAAAHAPTVYCFHAPLGREHWLRVRGMRRSVSRAPSRWASLVSAAFTANYRAKQQRAAVLRADAVTCPSEYSRDLLTDTVRRLGHKRIQVIPWGVDSERFCPAPDRAALRERFGWRPDEVVFFTARRLVPRMGVGELIRAFELAFHKAQDTESATAEAPPSPALRLVIAGAGPLRGRLEGLARRAAPRHSPHEPSRIEFAGLVPPDDLPAYLQAADFFVLPSIDLEAFGLVTLEALACGTPVLATNRCASPEILGGFDERLLIPGSEATAIAEAIRHAAVGLAAEPTLRTRCRDYVVANYSWDRTAAAFEQVARQLLAARRAPNSAGEGSPS